MTSTILGASHWPRPVQQVIETSYQPVGWLRSRDRRGGQGCDLATM